jgi:hypothetical protein
MHHHCCHQGTLSPHLLLPSLPCRHHHPAEEPAVSRHDVHYAVLSPVSCPRISAGAAASAAVAAAGIITLPKSLLSLRKFQQEGGIVREGLPLTTSAWLACRLIYPYMICALIQSVVGASIVPLVLSPQVGEVGFCLAVRNVG